MSWLVGLMVWIVVGVLFGIGVGLVWPSEKRTRCSRHF